MICWLSLNLLVIFSFTISSKLKQTSNSLPSEIKNYLAKREMRVAHYLFHQVRNLWNFIDEQSKNEIRKMGWEPPRPSVDSSGKFIADNNSGEDFLYMHRQMIQAVNTMLGKGNYAYGKKIVGWTDIPSPNDLNYPVPPTFFIFNGYPNDLLNTYKSDAYFNNILKPLSDRYKNYDFLRTLTLGQLGARLEFEVHNPMHVRWTKPLYDWRRDPVPFYKADNIDRKWDDPSYDWLLDFYASHVNEVFWKLHVWLDDRINDWQKANGVYFIFWKGMWTGGHNHFHSFLEMSSEQKEKNERVFEIIRKHSNKNYLPLSGVNK